MDEFIKLEEQLGYVFKNKKLLKLALSHSSYAHEKMIHREIYGDNERLEFLGDAVLELVTSDYLFRNKPDLPEGKLSKIRASLVCEPTLAECARGIGVDEYLFLGKGEKLNHGEKRDSIVSDAFEAIIGALYLDGGLDVAKDFIHRLVLTDIEKKTLFYDAKTELQVIVQNHYQCVPEYEVASEDGPPHDKTYVIRCLVCGKEYGTGVGNSKKNAQQHAAYETIKQLAEEGIR